MKKNVLLLMLLGSVATTTAFQSPRASSLDRSRQTVYSIECSSRKEFLVWVCSFTGLCLPVSSSSASAISVNQEETKSLQPAVSNHSNTSQPQPPIKKSGTLESGVSVTEFREGKGEPVVHNGSVVALQMTIRCNPNTDGSGGKKYYSTLDDEGLGAYAFTIGRGQAPTGLEEGMMGMRRGGVRRIELPSSMVISAKQLNQLPTPSKNERGSIDDVIHEGTTLSFDVVVTRVQ